MLAHRHPIINPSPQNVSADAAHNPLVSLQIAGEAARVAVLGIAPESRADRAAHYVAKSLQDNGVKIVPVPVYYFDIQVPHLCCAASSLAWHVDIALAIGSSKSVPIRGLMQLRLGSRPHISKCKHHRLHTALMSVWPETVGGKLHKRMQSYSGC